ncbi:MAG TPA: helix-turn-helix domain-containing protein [Solirubrobacterales bacterium]|nr:helix-turn-helix domain-containing protein [Solirubrobacterales bacterium]
MDAGFRAGAPRLTGEKAQRIVDAMRSCVAARGIAGATFDHVSREAGVSRGLLHYYFRTKEQLLIEVLRRDAETRIYGLDEPLLRAATVDEVLEVLVAGAEEVLRSDPGFYVILFELFTAGRQNPEIRVELAALYARSRVHLAEILDRKHAEGVITLRFDAETCVSHLFAAADGAALQRLTEEEHDFSQLIAAGAEVARFLLDAD